MMTAKYSLLGIMLALSSLEKCRIALYRQLERVTAKQVVATLITPKLVAFAAYVELFGQLLRPLVGGAAITNSVLDDQWRLQIVEIAIRLHRL